MQQLSSGAGALDKPAAPSGDGEIWTQRACRARPTHGGFPHTPRSPGRAPMTARRVAHRSLEEPPADLSQLLAVLLQEHVGRVRERPRLAEPERPVPERLPRASLKPDA